MDRHVVENLTLLLFFPLYFLGIKLGKRYGQAHQHIWLIRWVGATRARLFIAAILIMLVCPVSFFALASVYLTHLKWLDSPVVGLALSFGVFFTMSALSSNWKD